MSIIECWMGVKADVISEDLTPRKRGGERGRTDDQVINVLWRAEKWFSPLSSAR